MLVLEKVYRGKREAGQLSSDFVILSQVAAAQSAAATQSKDPYVQICGRAWVSRGPLGYARDRLFDCFARDENSAEN